MSRTLLVGTGRARITPDPAMRLSLAGMGHRPVQGVLDDLYARAAILDHGGVRLMVVSADLIWVPRPLCVALEQWAVAELGVTPGGALICATHTHGSPQTREWTFDGADFDGEYVALVERAMREAARHAAATLTPCTMQLVSAATSATVNRRAKRLDASSLRRLRPRIVMANRPNPGGAVDRMAHGLFFRDASGSVVAVMLNLACHASLLRGHQVTRDLPGALEDEFARRYGCQEFFFLQGFAGNVRASIYEGAPSVFKAGRGVARALYTLLFDRLRFAKDVTAQGLRALAATMADEFEATARTRDVEPGFSLRDVEVELPLRPAGPMARFRRLLDSDDAATRDYARFILAAPQVPTRVSFRIRRLSLARDVVLVGAEGEMFAEYALRLRRMCGEGMSVSPVSCAGGMVGYVPTAEAVAEGGYEPDRSHPMFGLPAPFAPEVEDRVMEAFREILCKGSMPEAGDDARR